MGRRWLRRTPKGDTGVNGLARAIWGPWSRIPEPIPEPAIWSIPIELLKVRPSGPPTVPPMDHRIDVARAAADGRKTADELCSLILQQRVHIDDYFDPDTVWAGDPMWLCFGTGLQAAVHAIDSAYPPSSDGDIDTVALLRARRLLDALERGDHQAANTHCNEILHRLKGSE